MQLNPFAMLLLIASTLLGTANPLIAQSDESMISTPKAIEMFEKRIDANPQDYLSLTVLGQLYLRHAKEADSYQAYLQAEDVLTNAIRIKPDHIASNIYLISALHSQHKFNEALRQAKHSIEISDGNLVAVSGYGDALMEVGRIDEAKTMFERVARKTKTPGVLARIARISELQGDHDLAIKTIVEARLMSIHHEERPVTTAWYDFRLGSLHLGHGDWGMAEKCFQQGIKRYHQDHRSMRGLAKVRITQRRFDEARTLLEMAMTITHSPVVIAELGDLLIAMDQEELGKKWLARAELQMERESKTTGSSHQRDRATFLLNHDRHLELALRLAKNEMKSRQDVWAHDTLAWALHKNGDSLKARQVLQVALDSKVRDAQISFHAALIEHSIGNQSEAKKHLEQCLNINPQFMPLHSRAELKWLAEYRSAKKTGNTN